MGAMHLVLLIFSLIAFSHVADSLSIVELLIVSGLQKAGCSTFASLILKTKVLDEYDKARQKKGLTIFAPSNAAFASPPIPQALKNLTADQVVALLKYHAVGDYVPNRKAGESIPTLASDDSGKYIVKVMNQGGTTNVTAEENSALVIKNIFNLSPVLIVAIDKVLLPTALFGKPLSSSPSSDFNMTALLEKDGCKTFASLIGQTKVIDTYLEAKKDGGVTIFAPSDEAFKDPELPDLKKLTPDQVVALLKYHGIGNYLPIGKLKETMEPFSTLATDDDGNNFILKASSDIPGQTILVAEKSLSGIEETIIDDNPSLVIFKINKVLLPKL